MDKGMEVTGTISSLMVLHVHDVSRVVVELIEKVAGVRSPKLCRS